MTTLADVPAIVNRAVRTGVNLHLIGEPGLGKTSVIEQVVTKLREADPDFGFWVIYTPSLSPVDFSVAMPEIESNTLKMYHNDKLPNAFIDEDQRGILFLGERDNADPATNKALQKYINGEDMGGLRKPKGVIVVSDSNDIGHRSGAVQQSLALLSRSRTLEVSFDADVAAKHFNDIGANVFVQAYLSLRKEHWTTFDQLIKAREYRIWANPRAWERVSTALTDAEANGETLSADEIIGDVGEGVGREFSAFLYAARELTSYDEIVSNPKKAPKPEKLSDTYAIIAMLSATVQAKDFAAVRTYAERYGIEVQVLFLRLLCSGKGTNKDACVRTPAYTTWYSVPEIRAAVLG